MKQAARQPDTTNKRNARSTSVSMLMYVALQQACHCANISLADAPLSRVNTLVGHLRVSVRPATEQDPVEKESKTDAELEDMILQRLLIGGVFVSVRRDPLLGWRPTVITAPKHARNAQELADKIAAELRKKFVLRE
jgi:hypothetical protein